MIKAVYIVLCFQLLPFFEVVYIGRHFKSRDLLYVFIDLNSEGRDCKRRDHVHSGRKV